jgi:spore maturation protein CgeB
LQVIEYRKAIEDCFEPGKELLTFGSYDELLQHILEARKSPSRMVKIREAASKRAHSQHTYRHRLQVILDNLC